MIRGAYQKCWAFLKLEPLRFPTDSGSCLLCARKRTLAAQMGSSAPKRANVQVVLRPEKA